MLSPGSRRLLPSAFQTVGPITANERRPWAYVSSCILRTTRIRSRTKQIFVCHRKHMNMCTCSGQRRRALEAFEASASSGARTNLKVGAPVQSKLGGNDPAQSAGKKFWSCFSTFLALKAQTVLVVLVSALVSTVWPVSCLLFFYSRCPRAQPFVKVGALAPCATWSRRHCVPPTSPPDSIATVVNSLQNRVNSIALRITLKAESGK